MIAGTYTYTQGDEHRLDLADPEFLGRMFRRMRIVERYFRYEVHGLERVPEQGRGLIISPHSAITIDGFLLGRAIFERLGRAPRGLTDHSIFRIPRVRDVAIRLGIVDGNRDNAVRLLERDELCFAMPGGGREAFKSSAKRYEILWEGHEGFVRVALRARAPIIPSVCIGADDALWSPFNSLELGRRLLNARVPIFPGIGILGPVPFPVKFTAYVGSPIVFAEPPEAAAEDAVVARCHRQVVSVVEAMTREGLKRRHSLWV
jgi:1-acyl-sn-glycerol-3-phosphate acyltransferase